MSFMRGEVYWRKGHVESYAVVGDAVDGVVMGGERYRVQISIESGVLTARCTCPVGSFCKHAVAVALAYLAKQTAPSRAQGPVTPPAHMAQPTLPMFGMAAALDANGPTNGAMNGATNGAANGATRGSIPAVASDGAPVAPAAPSFATRGELEAWAEEHQVTHALWLAADVLLAKLPPVESQRHGMRYVLGRLALRDIGSREGVSRLIGVRALEVPVAEAAYRELEQAAAIVRVGCDEEITRLERHPDPAIAPLWSRLIEARRVVRARAAPRSRAWRASGTWWSDARAGAVAWKEAERVVRGPYDYGTVGVAARLTMPGGGEPRLECTCPAPEARCTHSLALLDATLDWLGDPAHDAEARELAEELLRPGWSRLLKELDALEARAGKPRTVIEVWWRIDRELGTLTLSPTVKKQLKRGTMSTGTRPTVARLLEDHRDSLSDADLRIAEHVAAWAPPGRAASAANRAQASFPARAFLALIGHPRVTAEWSERPIEIQRATLGFTARLAGEQICLEPSLDGARVNPNVLAGLLDAFAPGEPLVLEEPERQRCLVVEVSDDARQLWSLLGKHGDAFPPESHGALLDRLSRLEGRLPLVVPAGAQGPRAVERGDGRWPGCGSCPMSRSSWSCSIRPGAGRAAVPAGSRTARRPAACAAASAATSAAR